VTTGKITLLAVALTIQDRIRRTAAGIKRSSDRLKISGDYLVIVLTRAGLSRFKLHVTLR